MEKELQEIIQEIISDLRKMGRKDAVIRWKYPDEPAYEIELTITNTVSSE